MPEPPNSSSQDVQRRRPRGLLPPDLVSLLIPALKVGGMSGGAGAITGLAAGIIRDAPPALFAAASSIQWFALGSSFWLSRSIAVRVWGGDDLLTPRDRVKASAIGGSVAGTVGGLLRGPRNIIPGAIVFTAFGAAGQGLANRIEARRAAADEADEDSSWFRSKWSPLQKLTDAEYEEFMSERMLKVETEIALIDDKIAELRMEEAKGKGEVDGGKAEMVPAKDEKKDEVPGAAQGGEKPRDGSWWQWPQGK